MKLFPIVFLLAVACLAVSAGEVRDDICNSQKTTTKLIARRTPPGPTATTTTTTAKPTTVTTTSSPSTSTAEPSTVSTTAPTTTTTWKTTTDGTSTTGIPSTTTTKSSSTLSSTTTTKATTTRLGPLFDCSPDPDCGNVCTNLTPTGGVVQSPNFPADYGNQFRYCIVTITAPVGKRIQLNFTTFHLETDKASVFIGNGQNYILQSTTGNAIPAPVATSTGTMVISFSCDDSDKPDSAIYNWQATFSVTN